MSDPNHPAQIFVLGATHHRVPIEVRERLAVSSETAEQLRGELARLDGLAEYALLNTCNRVEFYGVAQSPQIVDCVRRAFCERQNFDEAEFAQFCIDLRGQNALLHLLEVASGLDSQMLGETEIFGQVKDAYALAQSKGTTGAVLNRVFQKAFQAAKHVRTNTAITAGQVSIANVAVDLAGNIFGSLSGTRVLLVGAGEIGEKTAKAFQSRGAPSLTVCSRNFDRAAQLAAELGAGALPFEQREERLADFDIVVCATSAPNTVISTSASAAAMRKRPARPLLYLDLALPRDVEPAVASHGNVYLYNLDDLAKVAEENRRAREAEVQRAKSLLGEKAMHLWNSLAGRANGGNGSRAPAA